MACSSLWWMGRGKRCRKDERWIMLNLCVRSGNLPSPFPFAFELELALVLELELESARMSPMMKGTSRVDRSRKSV